jgi:hypothetical protein
MSHIVSNEREYIMSHLSKLYSVTHFPPLIKMAPDITYLHTKSKTTTGV